MTARSVLSPPYAEALGVTIDHWEKEAPVLVCGNPGTFHGGAIGGILEMAALATLRAHRPEERSDPLSITIEYLRSADTQRTHATARLIRAGRRLAIIHAEAWQGDRAKPVATALVKVTLSPALNPAP